MPAAVADEDAGQGADAMAATLVPPIVPLELAGHETLELVAGVDPALLRRELEEIRAILF